MDQGSYPIIGGRAESRVASAVRAALSDTLDLHTARRTPLAASRVARGRSRIRVRALEAEPDPESTCSVAELHRQMIEEGMPLVQGIQSAAKSLC